MTDNLRRETITIENEFLGVLFLPLLIQSYSLNPSLVPDVVWLCVSALILWERKLQPAGCPQT